MRGEGPGPLAPIPVHKASAGHASAAPRLSRFLHPSMRGAERCEGCSRAVGPPSLTLLATAPTPSRAQLTSCPGHLPQPRQPRPGIALVERSRWGREVAT